MGVNVQQLRAKSLQDLRRVACQCKRYADLVNVHGSTENDDIAKATENTSRIEGTGRLYRRQPNQDRQEARRLEFAGHGPGCIDNIDSSNCNDQSYRSRLAIWHDHCGVVFSARNDRRLEYSFALPSACKVRVQNIPNDVLNGMLFVDGSASEE